VPIGTKVEDLVDHCGGFTEEPSKLISGGPMMGQPLRELRVPIMKGSNGVLALTGPRPTAREPSPCIRCASCVSACPCGLVPLDMAAHIRVGDLDGAVGRGLMDCIGCGSCAYVCPAHIPLVQFFNHAKGEMAARGRAKQKQTETKRLAEPAASASRRRSSPSARPWPGARREAEAKKKAEAEEAAG
jgi:electron transport complex protein RnfC